MDEKAFSPRLMHLGLAGGWLVLCLNVSFGLYLDYRTAEAGRSDLLYGPETLIVFGTAMLSAAVVGSSLILRRPRHPVGWLFLALAVSLSVSATLDSWAIYGGAAEPGSLPMVGLAATVGDQLFIPWLTILGLVLVLTPSGRLTGRFARFAAAASVGGGVVAFVAGLVRPYRDNLGLPPTIENPLAAESLAGPLAAVGTSAIVLLHIGVLGGLAALIRNRSQAGGASRLLALTLIPFPLLVIGAWVAAATENYALLALAGGGFLAIVPIATAIAIEKDHLYGIDRLLSRGLTYSLLTGAVVGCYVAVVVVAGRVAGGSSDNSQATAVAATLVSMTVALPARGRLQDALDRRFSRRQYEVATAIRSFVREPSTSRTIEQVMRDALHDPGLHVAYWIDDRELWVDEPGVPCAPPDHAISVERRQDLVARVWSETADRPLNGDIFRAIEEARPELENARLRAAIALQLVEVRESRARIVAAQIAERRKLERNLHDGAQQRLLAIALQLRAAEVAGNPACVGPALNSAVHQLQLAVAELRELANGLHPSVLVERGLADALDDLAARTPVSVGLDVTHDRFPATVEEAAWYIACEAVTNAVKHANPGRIDIRVARRGDLLHISVDDDGRGGADPDGSGLRGIADRAETVGGRLSVTGRPGGGTTVSAVLPCE